MAETFSEFARRAQTLHSEQNFAEAALTWELAEAEAPDDMELARMRRGHGASLWRVSQDAGAGWHDFRDQAVGLLESALQIHDQAVADAPTRPNRSASEPKPAPSWGE